MKLHHPVSTIEVKRCFVVSNLCAARTHKGHMKKVESTGHFVQRVAAIRSKVLKMKEKQLDAIIGGEWMRRLASINAAKWYLADISTHESGIWKRAGELPLRWTNKSLAETAKKVRRALERKHGFAKRHVRAAHAVPGILATSVNVIQKEKYLLPIAFKGGTGTKGRRLLRTKMKADIDDGCMRSIALAVHGAKRIRCYFGMPR